jgi:peptidylprolyl isomerase
MRKAKTGDTVRVHFTGYLEDGAKFATTAGERPVELTIGEGKLLDGFEQNLIGMGEGEKKQVRLGPDQAAGESQPELIRTVPRHVVPEQHEDIKVGSKVRFQEDNGDMLEATVMEISDQEVTIDANKPLAGKTLLFDIELISFA